MLNESGFDRNPPAAEVSQGIEIIREFVDAKGNPLSRVDGRRGVLRPAARARDDRDRQPQIAIVDLLPGGVEPVLELQAPADSSTPGDGSGDAAAARRARARCRSACPDKSDWTPSHVDVREDRLILYGDAGKNAGHVRLSRAREQRRHVPGAAGVRRGDVQPHGRRRSSRGATLEVVKP